MLRHPQVLQVSIIDFYKSKSIKEEKFKIIIVVSALQLLEVVNVKNTSNYHRNNECASLRVHASTIDFKVTFSMQSIIVFICGHRHF